MATLCKHCIRSRGPPCNFLVPHLSGAHKRAVWGVKPLHHSPGETKKRDSPGERKKERERERSHACCNIPPTFLPLAVAFIGGSMYIPSTKPCMFNQFLCHCYREHVARRDLFQRATRLFLLRQTTALNRAGQPQILVFFQRALHISF